MTLIKSNPGFKHKRDILFRDFFEIDENQEKVSNTIRKYDLLCNRISEKTGKHIYFHEIFYIILSELNKNINSISIENLDEFYKLKEKLLFEYIPLLIYPNIEKLFMKIKNEGKTINISSNTAFIQGTTLKMILSHYSLTNFLTFQIYSDEIGVSKPNPFFFEHVYNSLASSNTISKKEIVHIGDNIIADYNGSISYGFNGILIKQ